MKDPHSETKATAEELIEAYRQRTMQLWRHRTNAQNEVDLAFGKSRIFEDFGKSTIKHISDASDAFRARRVRSAYQAAERLGGRLKVIPTKQFALNAYEEGVSGMEDAAVKELAPTLEKLKRVIEQIDDFQTLEKADSTRRIFRDVIAREIEHGKMTDEGRIANKMVEAIDEAFDGVSDDAIEQAIRENVEEATERTFKNVIPLERAKRIAAAEIRAASDMWKHARAENKVWRETFDNHAIRRLRIDAPGDPVDPAKIADMLLAKNSPAAIESIQKALGEGTMARNWTRALRHEMIEQEKARLFAKGGPLAKEVGMGEESVYKGLAAAMRNRYARLGKTTDPLHKYHPGGVSPEDFKNDTIRILDDLEVASKEESKFLNDEITKRLMNAEGSTEMEAAFSSAASRWMKSSESLLEFDKSMKAMASRVKTKAEKKMMDEKAETLRARLMGEILQSKGLQGTPIKGSPTVSGTAIENYIQKVKPEILTEAIGKKNYEELKLYTNILKSMELAPGGGGGILEAGVQMGSIYAFLTGNVPGIAGRLAAHWAAKPQGRALMQKWVHPAIRVIGQGTKKDPQATKQMTSAFEKIMKAKQKWIRTEEALRVARVLAANALYDNYEEKQANE
jgi:hypothetical protein